MWCVLKNIQHGKSEDCSGKRSLILWYSTKDISSGQRIRRDFQEKESFMCLHFLLYMNAFFKNREEIHEIVTGYLWIGKIIYLVPVIFLNFSHSLHTFYHSQKILFYFQSTLHSLENKWTLKQQQSGYPSLLFRRIRKCHESRSASFSIQSGDLCNFHCVITHLISKELIWLWWTVGKKCDLETFSVPFPVV